MQQQLNELNQKINDVCQQMEGTNVKIAKLDDELESYQSQLSEGDEILKKKVTEKDFNHLWVFISIHSLFDIAQKENRFFFKIVNHNKKRNLLKASID